MYDDGQWDAEQANLKQQPGHLLFTPGPLLERGAGFPDYDEVVVDGEIDQDKYNALIERRLLPVLRAANQNAEAQGHRAIITLPGLGCGVFAGVFGGTIHHNFDQAIENILQRHGQELTNIALVQGQGAQGEEVKKEIQGIKYRKCLGTPGLLNHPTFWQQDNEDFLNHVLYKVVAWDHFSWPGNDFYGGSRWTDDGVSAAATNICQVMTGQTGLYDATCKKFKPTDGNIWIGKTWEQVIKDNNIKLVANPENIKVSIGNQLVTIDEAQAQVALPTILNKTVADEMANAIRKLYKSCASLDEFNAKIEEVFIATIENPGVTETAKEALREKHAQYLDRKNNFNLFELIFNFIKELCGYGLASQFANEITHSLNAQGDFVGYVQGGNQELAILAL